MKNTIIVAIMVLGLLLAGCVKTVPPAAPDNEQGKCGRGGCPEMTGPTPPSPTPPQPLPPITEVEQKEPLPRMCTMEYMPVCGVDGQTYGNKCTAGDVPIAHEGECEVPPEQLLGGDRDEHGCIPSAGYSWCEAKQKCLRVWEESC